MLCLMLINYEAKSLVSLIITQRREGSFNWTTNEVDCLERKGKMNEWRLARQSLEAKISHQKKKKEKPKFGGQYKNQVKNCFVF